jgi:hypothetical protein
MTQLPKQPIARNCPPAANPRSERFSRGLDRGTRHGFDFCALQQRFLNIHSATYNTFYHQRYLLKRSMYKELRTTSFEVWQSASMAA